MSVYDFDWSEDAIAKLERLWLQTDPKISTAEIGRQMGVSKSAAVGKAHRIGLPLRPSPIGRRAEGAPAPRKPNPRPMAPRIVPVPREAPPCGRVVAAARRPVLLAVR